MSGSDQLKGTQVIFIPQPEESLEDVTSVRSISLLPILLKVKTFID